MTFAAQLNSSLADAVAHPSCPSVIVPVPVGSSSLITDRYKVDHSPDQGIQTGPVAWELQLSTLPRLPPSPGERYTRGTVYGRQSASPCQPSNIARVGPLG
jgi:hypothetical protein